MDANLPVPADPPPPPAVQPAMPWLLRRWLGFVMLGASLLIPGCTALFH